MYRSILVAVDGSSFAERSAPYAGSIARASKARVTVLQVVSPAGSPATDEAVAAQRLGIRAHDCLALGLRATDHM